MWFIILIGILAALQYFRVTRIYKHWQKKGISYLKPLPILGNMGPTILRKRALPHLIEDFYNAYPDKRYVGVYLFFQPVLIIRDPDLIKQITIKEFAAFPDHCIFKTGEEEHLSNRNLFTTTTASGWPEKRALLGPMLSSGRMKSMFAVMGEVSDEFTSFFCNKGGMVTVHVKDAFTRFANDVIARTAFGVTCNSLKDPENDFYIISKDVCNFTGLRTLAYFGASLSPLLMKILRVSTFSEKAVAFFENLNRETIRVREEKPIVQSDMIQILADAQKNGIRPNGASDIKNTEEKRNIEITEDDITALSLGFIMAGFETVSTVLTYAAYELAINPDIQKRLRDEVNSTLEECKGIMTYEALLGMKYLDCVISETLRKWIPSLFADRKSVKPFTIEPTQPGEEPLHLEAGTVCWIPIYAIHRDPQYYPNPEKFDPERFNDENKHNIKPFTYLPFSIGPRSCFGTRFALLEIKLLVVKILQTMELVPVKKTPNPVEFSKKDYGFMPEGGIWLGLKPIKATT